MDGFRTPAGLLDPREEQFRVPSHRPGLNLFLRRLPPAREGFGGNGSPAVLYVHGASFPSALSIAHRFDGHSWRDDLCRAGYDVWGLDFLGFGSLSDPYPEMDEAPDRHPPLGRAEEASLQLETAVRFILGQRDRKSLSIIAHSWGTMVAGRFAGRCPDLVDRLVVFGPITWRGKLGEAPRLSAWRTITLQDQWERFIADTPRGEPPVLLARHFQDWGERYLDCDPLSRQRRPPAVKVPLGPMQDIQDAWAGALAYDPGLIRVPVGIVRGAWDSLCTDADARWLFDALAAAPIKRDVKLSRGGHLMHLEEGRYALYRETLAFLDGGDAAPAPSENMDTRRDAACSP